jgi:hypothetical protein
MSTVGSGNRDSRGGRDSRDSRDGRERGREEREGGRRAERIAEAGRRDGKSGFSKNSGAMNCKEHSRGEHGGYSE